MDQYFVHLLIMDDGALMALMVALVLLGGLLGPLVFKVELEIQRIAYLWWIVVSSIVLTLSQVFWGIIPQATEAGVLWILMIAMMGCFVAFGLATYYGSAARSKDISGHRRHAWMGFIPLVNLWLMLKRGEPRPDAPKKSAAQRFVLDPLQVVFALMLLGLGNSMGDAIAESNAFEPNRSPRLMALVASAQTLEESLAAEAEASSAALPIRTDEITVFRSIRAEADTLFMDYDVEREFEDFKPGFEALIAQDQCHPEMFAVDLARGARLVFTYTAPSGRVIDAIEITQEDCNRLG